jgi:hypothetical protein
MTSLNQLLPGVAHRIARTLRTRGEFELAATVPQLNVVDRCRCGDDFCAMVYTAPPPRHAWGPGHRNLQVEATQGMVILDIVDDRITAVEILYQPEARERVLAAFP